MANNSSLRSIAIADARSEEDSSNFLLNGGVPSAEKFRVRLALEQGVDIVVDTTGCFFKYGFLTDDTVTAMEGIEAGVDTATDTDFL